MEKHKIKPTEEKELFKNEWETIFGADLVNKYNLTVNPIYQFNDPYFGEKVSTITIENVETEHLAEIINHVYNSLKDYSKDFRAEVSINSLGYDAKTKMIKISCDWSCKTEKLPKYRKIKK